MIRKIAFRKYGDPAIFLKSTNRLSLRLSSARFRIRARYHIAVRGEIYTHGLSSARTLRDSHLGRLPLFSHYYLSAFWILVSVMNDLLCRWMLFQATRRRKGEKRIYSRLRASVGKVGRRGAAAWEQHRRGMKTALVNGFPFSRTPLLSLYCLFPPFLPSFSPRISCSAFLFCTLVFNHPRSTGSSLVTRVNPGELRYASHCSTRRHISDWQQS